MSETSAEYITDVFELLDIDAQTVHVVGNPANRRRWAVRKAQAGLNIDIAKGETMADEKIETAPALSVGDALTFLVGAKANLTAEQVATLAELIKPAPVVKSADVIESEKRESILKDRIVALEKAQRMRDLEPICKGLGLDPEVVYKSEQSNPNETKHFLEKLDEANKRILALMKETGEVGETVEVSKEVELNKEVERVMKSDNISYPDALMKVASARPDLAAAYLKAARKEV